MGAGLGSNTICSSTGISLGAIVSHESKHGRCGAKEGLGRRDEKRLRSRSTGNGPRSFVSRVSWRCV